MLRQMEKVCREKGLLSAHESIVVACCGGPDSLALTDLLRRMAGRWGLRLVVAHFEHGIRGADSVADARFVEGQARKWGIPFYLGGADVPAYAKEHHLSLETAARTLRHRFLEETRARLGFDWIALAHHGDDQAETILMRILRGSGLDGLMGIRWRNGRLIRPLLGFRKEELLRYCREQGLQPRMDATNGIPDGTRNKIRTELLPLLRGQYNPSVETALLQLGRMAEETQDFLQSEGRKAWGETIRTMQGRPELSQTAFRQFPTAVQRVLLRRYLAELLGDTMDVEFVHMERLREMLLTGRTGEQCNLPRGLRVRLSYGWLHELPGTAESDRTFPLCEVQVPGKTELPAYGVHLWTEVRGDVPKETDPMEYCCDYRKIPAKLYVRGRMQGDFIRSKGGTKKLKELFIDAHLRQDERNGYPLLVSGKQILWVPGIRRSNLFPVDRDTKEVLYVKMEKRGRLP